MKILNIVNKLLCKCILMGFLVSTIPFGNPILNIICIFCGVYIIISEFFEDVERDTKKKEGE